MQFKFNFILPLLLVVSLAWNCQRADAQFFGVELHNTLMPVSDAMGGGEHRSAAGLTVRDQHLQHDGGAIPNVGAFSAKSEAEGLAIPNIGVTQDFSALGMSLYSAVAFH